MPGLAAIQRVLGKPRKRNVYVVVAAAPPPIATVHLRWAVMLLQMVLMCLHAIQTKSMVTHAHECC